MSLTSCCHEVKMVRINMRRKKANSCIWSSNKIPDLKRKNIYIYQIVYDWLQGLVKRLERGSWVIAEYFGLYLKVSEDALEETGKCIYQNSISGMSIWGWYARQTGRWGKGVMGDPLEDFVCIPGTREWVPRQQCKQYKWQVKGSKWKL